MITDATQVSEPAAPSFGSPLRFVTVASLFDGHDAAINVMRRLIQDAGVEVVHLGHNRSVSEIVHAAIQEDADGIAISSYQGGHIEYFRYVVDMLNEHGAGHIRVFGGGGGTITPQEIDELQAYGVERIYHPNDGMALGLKGMIDDLVERTFRGRAGSGIEAPLLTVGPDADELSIARVISALEDGTIDEASLGRGARRVAARRCRRADRRHHRHGRRRQEFGDRRAAQPLPDRLPGDPHRRAWRSTRPAGEPAGPCSATGSG